MQCCTLPSLSDRRSPSRPESHDLPSSRQNWRFYAEMAPATRRNSLLLRPIRRIRRGFCHRAVIRSIQTRDHDCPSMSSSSEFHSFPGKRSAAGVTTIHIHSGAAASAGSPRAEVGAGRHHDGWFESIASLRERNSGDGLAL